MAALTTRLSDPITGAPLRGNPVDNGTDVFQRSLAKMDRASEADNQETS